MSKIAGPQRLGPLTFLVGEWEGDVGVDLSYRNEDDETIETSYFEKAWFKPIPKQENGQQQIEGLTFGMTAWRHGEEAMIPFHDEVGYMLWEKKTGQVMRTVVFGRGIAMIAGGDAKAHDTSFHFKAMPGDPNYGILQNKYLSERAELRSFEGDFTLNEDGTFSYTQDLVLKLAALGGKEMHHTDKNTFHRVKRYHPSDEQG
ncbi:MAG: heme-binding beta-barrel domain-containing protein [Xanthomonadales bacterium]|nr:heme-binding beta-barrel domain-containing protein [Xanthomonadales bacterium]